MEIIVMLSLKGIILCCLEYGMQLFHCSKFMEQLGKVQRKAIGMT